MRRRGFAFNSGALISVPFALLFVLGILFRDRLPQVPTWLLIAGWLLLAAVAVSAALLLDSGRTRAMQRVARELGLAFSANGNEASLSSLLDPEKFETGNAQLETVLGSLGPVPPEVMTRLTTKLAEAASHRGLARTELRHLSLFKGLDDRSASNVMAGSLAGGSAVIFDYSYRTRDLDPGQTFSVTQTVAAFRFAGLALPAFELSPAGVVQRIASAIGMGDIDFESHPGFSQRYRLRGDDENAVRLLFPPPVLDFFESLDSAFAQTIEGAGECVVVYRGGTKVSPAAARAFISAATAVASRFGARSHEFELRHGGPTP